MNGRGLIREQLFSKVQRAFWEGHQRTVVTGSRAEMGLASVRKYMSTSYLPEGFGCDVPAELVDDATEAIMRHKSYGRIRVEGCYDDTLDFWILW